MGEQWTFRGAVVVRRCHPWMAPLLFGGRQPFLPESRSRMYLVKSSISGEVVRLFLNAWRFGGSVHPKAGQRRPDRPGRTGSINRFAEGCVNGSIAGDQIKGAPHLILEITNDNRLLSSGFPPGRRPGERREWQARESIGGTPRSESSSGRHRQSIAQARFMIAEQATPRLPGMIRFN